MEQTLHIKNLKIKKGELILRLSRPEKAIQLQASIVFQNTGFHFSHPVELSTDNSSEMVLKIDVSFLEQNDGDWTLVFQDTTSDTVYTAILDSKVRLALLLGRYYVRRGDFVYFPMGGSGHSFLLRCRHWQPHDRLRFRIKELSAFAIYKIFGKLLRKRHIWLIYEKFCVTAQENGFYFFEYCMKQNEKNVYFILDRKSPQWNDMQKYSQNVKGRFICPERTGCIFMGGTPKSPRQEPEAAGQAAREPHNLLDSRIYSWQRCHFMHGNLFR